jgi:hypothetical protein
MMWLVLFLLFHPLSSLVRVPIRQESSVAADLSSIDHDLPNRQFHINLKADRRCTNPTFILRLSGAALHKLGQIFRSDVPAHSLCYSYPPLVDAGQYFLDVVILFCDTYDPNNQTNLCLEDVADSRNVINGPYSFPISAADIIDDSPHQPRWKNTGDQVLVPTRYQLLFAEAESKGLYCIGVFQKDYCILDKNVAKPYTSYNWTDGKAHLWLNVAHGVKKSGASTVNTRAHALGRPLQLNVLSKMNVCFVGDSHSRELFFMAQRKYGENKAVTFTFVASIFPLVFSTAVLQQNLCSVAVISFGQWSLSPYAESPVSIDAFWSEMKDMFAAIKASPTSTRLFFRSENYNGLGGHVRRCPHADHRTPPAFDALNQAVRALCEETRGRIPFIDLDAIIGPMWDAAVDFCHPDAPVLHAEVDVILHTVFTHLRDKQIPVREYTVDVLGTTAPGRSEDHSHVEKMFQAQSDMQVALMRKIALERYGFVPTREREGS